jgi:molybdate transport system ATP-binding protein
MTDSPSIEATFSGPLGSFSLDVAFSMPMRGITALFGPSGSGKTTILRCLAGLQHLRGSLKVDGETWQDDQRSCFLPPHKRPIGYVFQESSLFAHLSVRDNLLYGARRVGRSPRAAFDDVVDLLAIDSLLGRAPLALSGGERQRVAIGRALLSQPRLLLMDEPLASLDTLTKQEILPHLEALHRNLSIPILYVSHDLSELARLADRVIVLSGGIKVLEGRLADVLEQLDATSLSERFDATVALTARVVRHDAEFLLTHLEHGGQTIIVPKLQLDVGTEARLRIHASDVSIATERPHGVSVRNILKGTVTRIVEDPATPYAEAFIDIGAASVRSQLTRSAIAELSLRIGAQVFVLVKTVTFDPRAP